MKEGKPELMWCKQHISGDYWPQSLANTKPWAHRWPHTVEDEDELEMLGNVRLVRVTITACSPAEEAEYEAQQEARKLERMTSNG